MVGFEAVISHVITTQYHNQTQQHHLLYNIKHDIQTTLLPLINLVSYYITLHYTTLHYTTHTHTLHIHTILIYFSPFSQTHQLTPNNVNITLPHYDTQCWQQLNVTHILQSLMIQVNNTQQHLLTLLHNMEEDNHSE